MKRIILIIVFVFIGLSSVNAQEIESPIVKQKIDTNFINKITEFPNLHRGCIFPVTLICNGKKTRVIVENGYFYHCLEKKFNFTQDEYIAYIRNILKNDEAVPFCLEEKFDNTYNICFEEVNYKGNNMYINEYKNNPKKLIEWAFDKDGCLSMQRYRAIIFEILYQYKVEISKECEIQCLIYWNDPVIDSVSDQ